MKFIATKAFRYGTRHLVADDTFDATEGHGRVLMAMRRAKKAPEPKRQRQVTEPELTQALPLLPPESVQKEDTLSPSPEPARILRRGKLVS